MAPVLRRRVPSAKVSAALASVVPIGVVLVLAVFLRVSLPGVAEFKLDEVEPLALAEQIWTEHRFVAAFGVSSTGLPETPLIGYLLVLPRILSRDPRWAVLFMALIDAIGVLLTYVALQRFAGRLTALIAAALYAMNPWAVLFSRKTWAEIIPAVTVLILWSACQVVLRGNRKWALLFFPLLALQVQAHVMGILFLPPLLFTLVLTPQSWANRYTVVGLLIGVLILSPYACVLNRAQAGESLAQSMTGAVQSNAGQPWRLDWRAVEYALRFASGSTLTALLGKSAAVLSGWERGLDHLHRLVVAMFVFGLAVIVHSGYRGYRDRRGSALLLMWLVGPLLPLIFLRGARGIHYLVLLVPTLFIVMAAGWSWLLAQSNGVIRGLALISLVTLLSLQGGSVWAIYSTVPEQDTQGGFGLPLGFWLQVQQGVQKRAAREGWRELQVLGADGAAWSTERRVLDHLVGHDLTLRWIGQGARHGIIVPLERESAALVLTADEGMEQALARWGVPLESWLFPGGKQAARLYRLPAVAPADLLQAAQITAPVSFDNGMDLLGVAWPSFVQPGDALPVEVNWAYTRATPPTGDRDTAFYHLVDATGKRWAQSDGFAAYQSDWRKGEAIAEWFTLQLLPDIPVGDYYLSIGMYSWRDMQRASVVDAGGQPVAGEALLGVIQVVAE